jgi:hypothetical protein
MRCYYTIIEFLGILVQVVVLIFVLLVQDEEEKHVVFKLSKITNMIENFKVSCIRLKLLVL